MKFMEPQDNVTTQQEQVSTPPTSVDESKNDTPTVDTENVQSETSNESQPEGATTDVTAPEGVSTSTEEQPPVNDKPEVSDEIQKKLDRLAEYELKDKELADLKGRLGVQDTFQDNQIFSAQQQLAIVENQAQQEYIRLCNAYGVDYRPDKIDASGEELREKNPQAFYELRYKLEGLNNQIEAKRNEVETFIRQKDIQSAMIRNKQVFDISPATRNVVKHYMEQGASGADIDEIVNFTKSIQQEAFEMGRQFALQEKAKVKPAEILNNTTISQQTQSTPGIDTTTMSVEDISKMSTAEFEKNLPLIEKLRNEGRLKL